MYKAYFGEYPEALIFEKHEDGNWVWMRRNIEEVEDEEGNVQYACDEVFFKTGAEKQEIIDGFDAYFAYGSTWKEESAPTIEERLDAVEEMLLEVLG